MAGPPLRPARGSCPASALRRRPTASPSPGTLECPRPRTEPWVPPARRAHAGQDSPRTRLPARARPADRPGMAAPPPRGAAAAQSGPGRPRSAHGAALAPAPARPRAPGPARRGSPWGDSAPRLRPRSGPAPRKGGAELGVKEKERNKPSLEHLSYERLRELSLFCLEKTGRGFR